MLSITRRHAFFAVLFAVLRSAVAGQHKGQLSKALRVQAATPLSTQALAAATPAPEDHQTLKPFGRTSEDTGNAAGSKLEDAAETFTPPPQQDVRFKLPKYQHVDSLSAATGGFLDWFLVAYWGVILLGLLITEIVHYLTGDDDDSNSKKTAHPKDPVAADTWELGHSARDHPSSGRASSEGQGAEATEEPPQKVPLSGRKRGESIFLSDGVPERTLTLSENVWALCLIASIGKARDRKQEILSPWVVFLAGFMMGIIQLLTLFLVMYDIDPSASPYTVNPAAPWKRSPLTVNTMKVVMVFFLGMYVVSEAADAFDNYILTLAVRKGELLVSRAVVLFWPIFHYLVTLSVILVGVAVVLSCQDVPNILYNSMAILFITRVDELFWGFFERTFDIDADWEVCVNESQNRDVRILKKCIIMFPMAWGFCLLGRAWYRDQMPTIVVRMQMH